MGHSSHCKYAIIAGSHHVRPKQIWFPTWLFMLGTACHVVLIFVPYMYPLYVTTSTKWRSQKSEKATKKKSKKKKQKRAAAFVTSTCTAYLATLVCLICVHLQGKDMPSTKGIVLWPGALFQNRS
jgi:carbon starvation protein CstA